MAEAEPSGGGGAGRSLRAEVEALPRVALDDDGIRIRIRSARGAHIGRLWIGQAGLRWAPGNVAARNARCLTLDELVQFLQSIPRG
jgi:hypothetical protein